MAVTWNLDQALLWIATRDAMIVESAADVKLGSEPTVTWRSECVGLVLDDEDAEPLAFIMLPEEAERALLADLVNGRIAARNDLDPVAEDWFDGAKFADDGDPPVMLFHRKSRRPTAHETPLGARIYHHDIEEVRPRFLPTEVQRHFPAVSLQDEDAPLGPETPTDQCRDEARRPPISEAALKRAYEQHLTENRHTTPPPNREMDVARLREMVPDKFIAVKEVHRLRAELAPSSWKDHGRRSKKLAE